MVREFKALGADCIKVSKSPGHYPDVMEAIADEGKKLGMFTMVDLKVSETDARVASNAGVKSIEHWYGIPDAALTGSQNFPTDYNYWNELDRFRYAGMLWQEADKNPQRISDVIDLMIKNGTNWDPDAHRLRGQPRLVAPRRDAAARRRCSIRRRSPRGRIRHARRVQARVEDVRRDQLEEELRHLDALGEDVPRARRPAHRRQRRAADRRARHSFASWS